MKKFLITGSAGFIGSALSIRLLKDNHKVIGIDNHNNYYDPSLKEDRLSRHIDHTNYTHFRVDIEDQREVNSIFKNHKFDGVINLAAQVGVRYSLKDPLAYIRTNILGFTNILEACRYNDIKHLVYASSSSVYGANKKLPYSINDNVDHPISLYAATKKSDELIAHTYSHLYNLPTTGLRFFTVYGPWDRPDMALQSFARSMLKGEKIQVFNHGKHKRDFTYIDDIIEGIIHVLNSPPDGISNLDNQKLNPSSSHAPWRIYNIGNNNMVELNEYIKALEKALKIKARKELLPMQPGDVPHTYADIEDLIKTFDYKPSTNIKEGVEKFAQWYLSYYEQ